jgi:hypothetical protein
MDYRREPQHPYHRGRPKTECSVCRAAAQSFPEADGWPPGTHMEGDCLCVPFKDGFDGYDLSGWQNLWGVPSHDYNDHHDDSPDLAAGSDESPLGRIIDGTGSLV